MPTGAEAAPYTILFTNDAKADVSSLDGSIRRQLRNVLENKLSVAPAEYGSALRGVLAGYWSHHFARHRIVYRIYPEKRLIVVCSVGLRQGVHRSDVYRRLEAVATSGRLAAQMNQVLNQLQARIESKPPADT